LRYISRIVVNVHELIYSVQRLQLTKKWK